jgi:glutaryl-CoA dehydrogenase
LLTNHIKNARSKPSNFKWEDPFLLDDQLSEEERMIQNTAKSYCHDKLIPRVIKANRREVFHREIMNEMGELGLLGSTIPEEFGGVGANYTSYGLSRLAK